MPAADDDAMLARLTAVTPRVDDSYVSLSGGVDSRFVLGCVRRAGVRPRLLHSGTAEYPLARSVASSLGLELLHSEDPQLALAPPISQAAPIPYTVMTDAQIIFAAGGLSRWRSHVTPTTIVHLGAYALAVLKNTYTGAWWIPVPSRAYYPRLIRYALLATMPATTPLLRHWNRREDLVRFLAEALADQPEHLRAPGRKALANWFYYLNRGLRWTSAITAEASFFVRPTFILSDRRAMLLGLASSPVANLAHARARALNRRLLPEVETPYANGLPATPAVSWRMVPERLGHELVPRFWRPRPAVPSAETGRGTTSGTLTSALVPSAGLSAFTIQDPELVLRDPTVPSRFRRALITLSHVLAYLGRPRGDVPPA